MKNSLVLGTIITAVIMTSLLAVPIPLVDGHPHPDTASIDTHTHEPQTEIIPLDGTIGIEKTILLMNAPIDNTLPWGFVEGKIANNVPDYPVIIQIYDSDGDAFHFAQTDVQGDGTYEYKFRVRNVENGQAINIFEGDYAVNIFKVVYLTSDF